MASTDRRRKDRVLLSADDVYLFNEGTHTRLYEHLGAHLMEGGTHFAVWAPNAEHVSVVGDFNRWDPTADPLFPTDAGIWRGLVSGTGHGSVYKYYIKSRESGDQFEKADPLGFLSEVPPKSASVVWDLNYEWNDGPWMEKRAEHNDPNAPISIYEVHLGSWTKAGPMESFGYRDIAPLLASYLNEMGYTHVEFMPVMEHPYYPSWGYQQTGYFAPTSRYGTPQDLMYLIDYLHQHEVGVILDWVPSHFATDGHGLGRFDGTHLYEHEDARLGWHPDWNSAIFNYGRKEVRSFLLSSALFWLDRYHADGLRVDAVASMLYLDYSRDEGEWLPNRYGGNENLEAISLLKELNAHAYGTFPGIMMVAEESTNWGGVSRPTDVGGLGFGFKWDMGWMHDTLEFFAEDPVHRGYHLNELTFRMLYAYTENFMLSLSHDEVVHGKSSLLNKMPGDEWQKFANLRLLYGYMYGLPGKKLLFMGGEFAQGSEWAADHSLDWYVLDYPNHEGMQRWVRDLNLAYRREPALHELDLQPDGFEWVDASDTTSSVVSFLRRGRSASTILVICNLTPVPRQGYRVGVPFGGYWTEILNSDSQWYWGSGQGNEGGRNADQEPMHGRPFSLMLDLPPLSAVFFRQGP